MNAAMIKRLFALNRFKCVMYVIAGCVPSYTDYSCSFLVTKISRAHFLSTRLRYSSGVVFPKLF